MANRDTSRSGINKPGLLTLTIKDKSALYMAYMPFVKQRGPVHPDQQQLPAGR
jgi:type IV pilus assembly protein PilZ